MTRDDWRYRAACAGQELELFFPLGNTGRALKDLSIAQQVCAGCPVRQECLQWALDHDVSHGVWGGFGEEQRMAMRRRAARRQAKPGTIR